ncbi:MAG: DUF3194 domain-containing protein [Methanobacteriaceae archaeon]|nr:DUF3194 domain-containing protein [Candidatus Methanorudis spinitermitis]
MKKLKEINQEDLYEISDFLSDNINEYILANVPSKEILDIDIKIEVSYDDKLDVDVSVNLEFHELSKADSNIPDIAVEHSLLKLNSYLDENFRV